MARQMLVGRADNGDYGLLGLVPSERTLERVLQDIAGSEWAKR
jgi:hypothetical protein